MKNRRYFLEASTVIVGTAFLSKYFTRKSEVMTAAKNEFEITKTEEEWRKTLTPEQFHVLRKHGTERAGTSPLDKQYAAGTYVCAGCDLPLFTSETKFNSGTGWPSFYAPIEEAIATSVDKSFFMTRVEVHCHRCGGHLGHVFNDGPAPTGKRYCMNGAALKFIAS
ncbi:MULTISPECIES: peptide-methionine (R)-S-oxide reductase MsrB [Calothrix]|uniref:peptide-methionine (R)-S-oxide reductase n=2 Tax=Calothrix TaxID=1186 RepID=A0ABR8AEE8_9CYAN|nr:MULTISPECIES: peptide-methionine (R)-S-oxide reductase MsrB [Calothrix]MBD2197880.1 peptide-methionine (R)-S-oxide reductase MsrB [Calothrix parietina FACHB-288]MBD2226284.1 peptide-methionine (R)-S-oxide reductase MsrB [Calothrix anomala FACHB-343]